MPTQRKEPLSQTEIDQLIIAEVDDDAAWEDAIYVQRTEPASISIPADLAARAAFLAQLHRKSSLNEWITDIIQERIELEEAAFSGAKRDLLAMASG